MSYQVTEMVSLRFNKETCSRCGIRFMLEAEYMDRRRSDGNEFFCPNGHSLFYGDGDREKLDKARAEISRLNSQVCLERDQRAATEKSLELLRKRVSKGVCPCCHRTVRQLERHMKSKHPNYPNPT